MYETPFFSQKLTKGGVFLNINKGKELKSNIIKRNYITLGAMLIVFVALLLRLAYLQLTEGPTLSVSADKQYYYEEYTDNITFKLLDNKGENLFNPTSRYYVVIDPMTFYTLNDESAFIDMRKVLYILRDYDKEYDISQLQEEMDKGNHKYEVDKETLKKIKDIKNIKGIYAYEYDEYDKKQNWNIKNILATPVLYLDNNVMKDEGTLEIEINNYIQDNYKDKIRFERDVSENIVSEEKVVNPNNNNVITTLNKKIQESVEDTLRLNEFKQYDQIGAVLMESKSGKILAMAQKDDGLSNPNIAVTNSNGYLLGSTFKTIVYEAALENNLVDEDEVFRIDNIGEFKDSIEYQNEYTIQEAYIQSSNKAFINIGVKVGIDRIYNMAKSQGLFDSVLGLQDEAIGTIDGYDVKKNIDIIALTSIGQTARSTPLGALAIANTVVNNGVYVKPRIIDSIVKNNGMEVQKFSSSEKQVISEYTAEVLKKGMLAVVNSNIVDSELRGTGYNARIEGIEVGGKTGTTEYVDGNKKLSDGWFTGFFQYKGKYYSMVVFIPHSGAINGESSVACKVFKQIVENMVKDELLN